MKNRLIAFLVACVLTFSNTIILVTATGLKETYKTIEYYPDGSYSITELSVSDVIIWGTNKTANKTQKFYDKNDNLVAEFTLTAKFFLNNGTVSCTNVTYSKTIQNSKWSIVDVLTQSSGSAKLAVATGTGTLKDSNILTRDIDISVTIKCDFNGLVS